MIEAKELRIGNWVSSLHGYQKVIAISGDLFTIEPFNGVEMSHYPGLKNGIESIPLTPEILESCGFKYDSDEMGDSLAEFYINGDFIWSKGLKELYFKHTPLPHIEYLHQLQNLYFAITGQELKVNLNVAVNQ